MRSIIYSLREVNNKIILSIDLTGNLIAENSTEYHLKLSTGALTLNKWDYLNKFKIFDDGKNFFCICNKQVDREYVFKKLLEYRINKFETYKIHFDAKISEYRRELNSLKLKAA